MKKFLNTIDKFKNGLLLIVFLLGVALQSNAQNTVNGTVTDEDDLSIPGVNIVVKGTSQGTVTNIDGEYSLDAPADAVLVYSFIGYKTQEIAVDGRSTINVQLKQSLTELNEVVVVGYGTQKKRDITGAVASVNVAELDKSQSINLTDRLQGRVSGISVVTSGAPGSTGTIKIRGTSFLGNNNPLYVIDGILTNDSPNLNPYDVESVQILKDASSTAIYGSRAANGVVVITTKKGKSKIPKVNFSSQVGIQQIPNRIKMMDNVGFARVNNAANDNAGLPRMTKADVDFDPRVNTDWQDEMFNSQALIQNFNISVSNSGEKYNAYFSVNNSYNEGTVQGTLFDRVGARVNTNYSPWKRIKIGQNLMVSRTRNSGLADYIDPTIFGIYQNLPIIPVYDPTKRSGYGYGEIGIATCYVPNPKGQQDLFKNINKSTQILGNAFLDLNIMDGLDYHFSVGVNTNFNNAKSYNPRLQIRMADITQSSLNESRSESVEVFLENRLTFKKTYGNHSISAMVTHTEQKINGTMQSATSVAGYPQPPYFWVLDASITPTQAFGNEFTSTIRSYLGRLVYNYADKYMITGIVRYDGSSKFAKENRWGTFPSVSAGWDIAKEEFFNVEEISHLKIRVGYGEVGNSSIGDYQYQSLIQSSATGGVNYNFGPNSDLVIGATRGTLANRDITWETLKETNVGLDMSLLDGQIELTADYFKGNMEGLLASVPVPGTIGPALGNEITINAVDMKRNGWEASVTYKKTVGNFKFNTTLNAWHNNNEITKLPFGVHEFPGDNSTSRLGIPLGQLFLVEYLGIYTSQEQIDADNVTINGQVPVIGDARYRDIDSRDQNGNLTGKPDGNISFDDDRQIWGNPIPKMEYGLNFDASWKNFDLYIFFQGVTKRDVYNAVYANLNTFQAVNYTADYDPYIDGAGTEPRPFNGEVANNFASTRFVENGAYLRLKNLQIGYTLPWRKVNNLRFYVSGQNLFLITKYKGMDPEFEGGVFEPGVDPVGYPQVRTFSAGINITL